MAEEWRHISIGDHVIKIAHWAVDTYNGNQGTILKFRGVWTASVQEVVGKRYLLKLEATNGEELHNYMAKVLEKQTCNCVLEDFKLENFKPVDPA